MALHFSSRKGSEKMNDQELHDEFVKLLDERPDLVPIALSLLKGKVITSSVPGEERHTTE